jgi:hypothetical protein
MRVPVLVLLVLASLTGAACGAGHAAPQLPDRAPRPYTAPADDPGFNGDDPGLSLLPDSHAAEVRLLERLGHRRDFRIPYRAVRDRRPGPIAWAVIARMWNEIDVPDPRYGRLNAGQRALFALQWADYEILDGGFDQFWFNSAGWFGGELAAAAHRVGAPEYERVFRDAAALFRGGRVPRDRGLRQRMSDAFPDNAVASLDDRYFDFQYHRRTTLGLILGRYVRAHPGEFFSS